MKLQKTAFQQFCAKIYNPFSIGFYLFIKIPSAFFSGVRVLHLSENICVTTVPYKWFSKNPFKSTYFACLSMAAELSTGLLAAGHVYKKNPPVSMLVSRIEGNFYKKSTEKILFTCSDGDRILRSIDYAITSGKATTIETKSSGKNKAGDIVAEFTVIWSFKAKAPKV